MKRLTGLLAVAAAFAAAGALGITDRELEKGFFDPPASARPHTWWHWMNGNVTKEGITADLEAMAQIGLGGAQAIPDRKAYVHHVETLDEGRRAA